MKKIFLLLSLAISVCAQAVDQVTVAQFIANGEDGVTYRLKGVVSNITNTTYGNFDLSDETGKILVYGLKTAAGVAKQFSTLDIAEGDTVVLDGKYKYFNNKTHEVDGAVFVSRTKPAEIWEPVPISISEFITNASDKRYILTGVVTEIANASYGNLYLEDNTGSIYVYGISNFSNYDVAVNDTLTISGIYKLFGSTHEVSSGQYISHKHPVEPSTQEEVVDFATAFADGWDKWIGKTVTFTNDFYYCDTWNNTIACRRLRAPEEYGEEGTSEYAAAAARNTNDSCHLTNPTISWQTYRLGTIIRGLKAYIPAANQLQAVNSPELINNAFPTTRPDLGDATLVVCVANVENFFVDNVGEGSQYHGAQNETQLATQKAKLKAALTNMNADIYALAEVEQGTNAVTALVNMLNEQAGSTVYTWVKNGSSSYNSGMVCYIYNKNKVELAGSYMLPYSSYALMKWREAIQGFREIATGEKFYLSMNHFFAKSENHGDADRQTNMNTLITKLSSITADPDILVVGDLNAYTMEESNLLLSRDHGYVDLLQKFDPEGYSHLFDCTVGFLDHAYCTSTMEPQVTKAVSYHLNADTPKSLYGYTAGDESMYRYSDHEPLLIGLRLGKIAEALEDLQTDQRARKTLENGQLILTLPDGTKYNVIGLQIR